jgi:SOS-response transcriptional repressor LexA
MTNSQEKLYVIIKEFIEQFKYSPSIRELCELYGVSSPATMLYHLRKLRELGMIDFQDGKSRTIVLR